MIQISINLPRNKRLDLHVVKRRKSNEEKSFLLNLQSLRRIKKGNIISRFFRHIFEHSKVKKFFGTNLAILVLASTAITQNRPFEDQVQEISFTQSPVIFQTQIGTQYPIEKVKITQGYQFYHPGIDLDGETGDIIRPIMAGRVTGIEYSSQGYGNAILIDHGGGSASLYAHLSQVDVELNQEVSTNRIIGKVGTSGRAYGDHLHLEIYERGSTVNPLDVLRRN